MKVLHIQTAMTSAGNAAFRLHTAMCKQGIDSTVLTLQPSVKRNNVINLKQTPQMYLMRRLVGLYQKRKMRYKKIDSYSFSLLPVITFHNVIPYLKDVDAVYLHWIAAGFLSARDIENIARSCKKVIFFMHDMWTMTGGCHHSFSCKEYLNGCKYCPMFKGDNQTAKYEADKKRSLFNKYDNLIFISPSNWMKSCAENSYILKGKPIYSISNVVDEFIFKPYDKKVAKQILNLPLNKHIITFGCQAGVINKFKGFDYLRDAINQTDLKDILLLVYGSDYNQRIIDELKFPIHFLGPINDEYTLSLICNASDLFVSPSLAESFGLTFLENTLCGTPVVGFNCTAVPELVQTGNNGYLARLEDADDLKNGIESILTNKVKLSFSNLYSSENIVKEHLRLLEL